VSPTVPSLEVRRVIAAPPDRLFDAWTTPSQLVVWWGPRGVRCTDAAVDLRVGGKYHIKNELPDGRVVVIRGTFLQVERPQRLVYTWLVEPGGDEPEQVTVCFEARGAATEVVVIHERIADTPTRDGHEAGWVGCLEKLDEHAARR
jgi:glutathione S-transferase